MPRQSAVLLCLALATGSLARSLYIESSASGSGDMSGDVSGSAEYSGSADMSGSGETSGFEPVDCTTASDGLYSLGPCETRFLTCSGGIARIMDCPAGLVYNAAIIACDWPANVCLGVDSSASGSGDLSASGSGDLSASGSGDLSGSGSGEDSGSGEASGFEPVDCTTAPDGLYSLGECMPQFLTCSGGIARIMDCPAGLFYNATIVACDWPANGCLGVDFSGSGSGDFSGSGDMSGDFSGSASGSGDFSGSGSGEESGSGDGSAFEPVDCATAPDGLYALGSCETRFLTCSGGIARIMDCPADLIYRSSIEACDWPANAGCA